MTDGDLLIFGCLVTFLAAGGAYVLLRERYLERGSARERAKALHLRTEARRSV